MWRVVTGGRMEQRRTFDTRHMTTLYRFVRFYLVICFFLYIYFRCYWVDDVNTDHRIPSPRLYLVPVAGIHDGAINFYNLGSGRESKENDRVAENGIDVNEIENRDTTDKSDLDQIDKDIPASDRYHKPYYEWDRRLQQLTRDWALVRNIRVDWKQILRPCVNDIMWGRKAGREDGDMTSANASKIVYRDIRPAGEYSRILIQACTIDGRTQIQGGDSWRVYARGRASIAATVLDHNNGTYEALFLIMDPGDYELVVYLDYSQCDGLRDPPQEWFVKGNAQGKYQAEGMLGRLNDFLLQRMVNDGQLSIKVPPPRMEISYEDLSFPTTFTNCTFLWDGYGRWVDSLWRPFIDEHLHWQSWTGHSPSGVLWIYGDSVAKNLVLSARRRALCNVMYTRCEYSYNWVYPVVHGEQRAIAANEDNDFDADRVLGTIRDVLTHPDMNNPDSTLLLNLGLHFTETINFTTYRGLIDKIVAAVTGNHSNGGTGLPFKARVIWKTTTAIWKENAKVLNTTHYRFLTSHRILLFNAYASWAMCRAGVDILDVHPITDSYPYGPFDVVHYFGFVTHAVEKKLEQLKIARSKTIRLLRVQRNIEEIKYVQDAKMVK